MARAKAAVSPRSSASIRARVVMRSYKLYSHRVLRPVEHGRLHGPGSYSDPLDVRRGRGQDVELEPVQNEPLARTGDAAERLHEQAAHRLRPAAGRRRPE